MTEAQTNALWCVTLIDVWRDGVIELYQLDKILNEFSKQRGIPTGELRAKLFAAADQIEKGGSSRSDATEREPLMRQGK